MALRIAKKLVRLFPPPSPSLRELPLAILSAALFGAIIGPCISVPAIWLLRLPWATISQAPIAWLADSGFAAALYSVCFYLTCALPVGYVRRALRKAPPLQAVVATVLTGFAGGALGWIVVSQLMGLFYHFRTTGTFSQLTLITASLAMALALALSIWDRMQAEKMLAAERAQYRVLQAQINPHFFFNTLNTISALIPIDPNEAQRTIGLLADLSRYAFASGQTDAVPLARELDFARTYLEIEKARFRNRLWFELPENSAVQDITVPALALQPLIENAVRYGAGRNIHGGGVIVRVHREGAQFSLTIENETDGAPDISEEAFFRAGHALSNIRQRLLLAYKDRAWIRVAMPRPQTVVVTIQAPIRP